MQKTLGAFIALSLGLATAAYAQTDLSGPVKIGVLNDRSGPYADTTGQGSVIAAQMAIEDFGGSVLGKKIELLSADHQLKPDVAVSIVRRWVDQDQVDAFADLAGSAVTLAVQEYARTARRIVLNTGSGSSDLNGKSCSPTATQWSFDTYVLAASNVGALLKRGLDTWFFLTVDYSFGYALKRDATKVLEKGGGRVVGSVHHPLNSSDFSSFLLQAQASGAKVIAIGSGPGDSSNILKQAAEFRIAGEKQTIANMLTHVTDISVLGASATGMTGVESFYWDLNDATRAWTKRFQERGGRLPSMVHAGTYSAVMHYLKAIKAAGTKDADAVMAKMREIPVNDFYTKDAHVRPDGLVARDYYLLRVKDPKSARYKYDIYDVLATIPASETVRPLEQSECPLVKGSKS